MASAAQGTSTQNLALDSEAAIAEDARNAIAVSVDDWIATPECEPQFCAVCAVQAYLDCRSKGSSVASFECVGYGIPPIICMCLYTCNSDEGVIDRILAPRETVSATQRSVTQ